MISRCAFMSRSELAVRPPEERSRRWFIAELDMYTSIIVRRRDRRCVTCGERRGLQCSHFYSRRYLALRFDLRNCNAMCAGCNRRHNVDRASYETYMLERYGSEVVAELDRRRLSQRSVSDDELQCLLSQYKAQ